MDNESGEQPKFTWNQDQHHYFAFVMILRENPLIKKTIQIIKREKKETPFLTSKASFKARGG